MRLCWWVLPKPMPGSSATEARSRPAATSVSRRERKCEKLPLLRRHSAGRPASSAACRHGCIAQMPARVSRASASIAGSPVRAVMSLIASAPAATASRATRSLAVSIDIGRRVCSASDCTTGRRGAIPPRRRPTRHRGASFRLRHPRDRRLRPPAAGHDRSRPEDRKIARHRRSCRA